jgi:hypothetical protein
LAYRSSVSCVCRVGFLEFLSWQIPQFSWEFASSSLSSWLSMDGALSNERARE